MYTGIGQVVELILENDIRQVSISCAANLIPAPGQYLLAGTDSQIDPLPVSLFCTESTRQGFIAYGYIPESWVPGTEIALRGPLGHGFILPISARKVALVAFDDSPSRLKELLRNALKQEAAVAFVCDSFEAELPDVVEVQPLSALEDVLEWADYTAIDISRENLQELKRIFGGKYQVSVKREAQVLIRTPIPCGGIAACGVCSVTLKSHWKLSCKDGPVFDLKEV